MTMADTPADRPTGPTCRSCFPLGYHMKDDKSAVVEDEAERVRLIYRHYLELGGVNALVRDLRERDIRTKSRLLATGATRGGVPFSRGSLFYLLRNRFYVGEVKYKDEILPGEQPAIMDRAVFDAVQQKLTDQWTTRSTTRNASDHPLTGLLFDDVGHRMVPTHATKAGVRYRYYVSLPHLHGESKTASVGSISRVPATDIENIIVKSLNEHLVAQKEKPAFNLTHVRDGKAALEQVARIDVHEDRLATRLKSAHDEETADAADDHLLSIPWQKPPSRKSRQILIPDGIPKSEIRPTRDSFEHDGTLGAIGMTIRGEPAFGRGSGAVQLRAQSPAAGNGIFGCRDRAPKSPLKCANVGRDQNPRSEWPEIPAETPYSESYRKRAVCEDWMVGAPGLEPRTR